MVMWTRSVIQSFILHTWSVFSWLCLFATRFNLKLTYEKYRLSDFSDFTLAHIKSYLNWIVLITAWLTRAMNGSFIYSTSSDPRSYVKMIRVNAVDSILDIVDKDSIPFRPWFCQRFSLAFIATVNMLGVHCASWGAIHPRVPLRHDAALSSTSRRRERHSLLHSSRSIRLADK